MRVVITGASGLVGEALGQRLVREGVEVLALVRPGSKGPRHFPCQIVQWKSLEEPAPVQALEAADAVIHLAGENISAERWSSSRKQVLRDSRIVTLENLRLGVEMCRNKPDALICASGVGYYGDCGDRELAENADPGRDFLATLCQEWEAAADRVGVARVAKLRFGVVLSAQGGFLREVAPMFAMFGASCLGSGRQWFSWIHIDDLVELIWLAVRDPKIQNAINAVAPQPVTNRELTDELARIWSAFPGPSVPTMALKILYGELAEALVGSQRARAGALEGAGFRWSYNTIPEALKAIYGEMERGEFKLVFEQWVAGPMDKVWPFFATESNLERITPPQLNFHVLGKSTAQIEAGTLIDYKLKMRGLPMHWQTRICEWTPPSRFVDEQLKGPYSKWHHTHDFSPLADGVLMRDTIRLKPPLGWVGRMTGLKMVLSEVDAIFAYRSRIIREVFDSAPAAVDFSLR